MINQWKRLQNLKYFHSFLSFFFLEKFSLCSQEANRHKTNFQMTLNTYWRHSEFKSTVKHLSRMFWGDNNKRIIFKLESFPVLLVMKTNNMERQGGKKNLSVNGEKLVVFFKSFYQTLPNWTHPRDMIAYLTQNFPTIHGCNCGSSMPVLIKLHKAVWIMTLCLQRAREPSLQVTFHQHKVCNWTNKTIRTKFFRKNQSLDVLFSPECNWECWNWNRRFQGQVFIPRKGMKWSLQIP